MIALQPFVRQFINSGFFTADTEAFAKELTRHERLTVFQDQLLCKRGSRGLLLGNDALLKMSDEGETGAKSPSRAPLPEPHRRPSRGSRSRRCKIRRRSNAFSGSFSSRPS